MKDQEFLMNAMDQIDDDLIEEARVIRPRKSALRWLSAAAVLAIIVGCALVALTAPDTGTIIPTDPILQAPDPTDSPTLPSNPTPPSTPPAADWIIPAPLDMPDLEQGFVGDPSSIQSPSAGTGELRFPSISVTAKAVETLQDTYYIVGNSKDKFRLVKMETIKSLVGQNMVDSFYYILPEDYMTDLTKYDALVIKLMRQFAHSNSILYNDTTDQLQVIDQVIFGYYTYLSGSVITAFTEGTFDEGLWHSTDVWTNEVGNHISTPKYTSLEDYEDFVREFYSGGYSDAVYNHIAPENSDVSDALNYVRPFDNGVFIPQLITGYFMFDNYTSYRRYANGYPTNETVFIAPDRANYSKYQFTDKDLNNLPDLASALQTINTAYDAGQITPPHLKGWENMRSVSYVVFGWYAKTDNGVYGVIRVSWKYADDTKKYQDDWYHYDDQYYLVETDSSDCQPITHSDLTALLGKYASFVIQTEGYNDSGRIIENDILSPIA